MAEGENGALTLDRLLKIREGAEAGMFLSPDLTMQLLELVIPASGVIPALPFQTQPTLLELEHVVCCYYAVPSSALRSRRRTAMVAHARQMLIYLARKFTAHSLSECARHVGRDDHTTAVHAVNRIWHKARHDLTVAEELKALERGVADLIEMKRKAAQEEGGA